MPQSLDFETWENTVLIEEVSMSELPEKIVRSDTEWRTVLTQEQYQVLRQKGTERPFTGALTQNLSLIHISLTAHPAPATFAA